jgi:transducin (beta)-like 1
MLINCVTPCLLGFRYSSFAFQHESQIHKSEYRNANVQPGALVDVLHKGLQYMDIETHLDEVGSHPHQ